MVTLFVKHTCTYSCCAVSAAFYDLHHMSSSFYTLKTHEILISKITLVMNFIIVAFVVM